MKDLGKRPLVMGIINVTPDSFSGDGVMDPVMAADLAMRMVEEGADILDVGGESSRPGAAAVSAEDEIGRVVPVIAAIRKRSAQLPVSIDTTKASVAAAACDAGATVINDVSALMGDASMGPLAARRNVPVVLMHNRVKVDAFTNDARIGGQYNAPDYGDIVEDVVRELGEHMQAAQSAGIAKDRIIVDPGIGFGKTVAQNCALIDHIGVIKRRLDCPVLIGASRKSFIGRVLDTPPDERLEGTAAAVAVSVIRGADIIRVHDVKFMVRVVRMTRAIAGN